MDKAKNFLVACVSAAALLSAGCSGLTNLTPERVPENSSRVYTLSMSAYINDGSVVQDSIKPFVVIDGETIPMKEIKDMKYDRLYEYDYTLPKGRKDAKYYFLLKYQVSSNIDGVNRDREMKSPTVYTLSPATRYIVNMQNERGPVGASIPILGRGFDKEDKICVGGVIADTEYLSRSTLNFIVPPLESGKTYDVELIGEKGEMWIGAFRVDTAKMGVSPSEIKMTGGDLVTMIFNIGFTAPKGGYPIDVKTNIPSSIIMDEVVVPEGQSSVSVTVKAAAPGKGFLYINGLGFKEKTIPVEITSANTAEPVIKEAESAINEIDAKAESPSK